MDRFDYYAASRFLAKYAKNRPKKYRNSGWKYYYTSNVRPLLQKGKELTNKRPNTFITDGAPNFHDAFNKEFWTNQGPRIRHISHIRLQGDHNNNKMERLNGEVRDREKVMRGLKKSNTAILTGYQLFHNHLRPHEALNGKTPAERCGIIIEGQDKWKTVIENAMRYINNLSAPQNHKVYSVR